MIGSLVYQDYVNLIKNKNIISNHFKKLQIQPSSIDLSLSSECYEINYSFLSPNTNVREKIKKYSVKKINLEKKYLFKTNKTYLVKLNEKLYLKNNIFGHCNPKSSTGRLDIFCRTIVDYTDEYEKIPINYKGEIFLEITSRSFNIEFQKGDILNQLRLVYKNHLYLNDIKLNNLNLIKPIIYISKKNKKENIKNGLKVSVELSKSNNVVAYRAKNKAPKLNFRRTNFHNIIDYWEPLKSKNNSLIIEKNKFYILRSKEKIRIPANYAGEMVPYDTRIGDFRAHYAGFFDPGFGDPSGSYAVLEVKTYELPFTLEDGQTIARIKYEKLNKKSNIVYGKDIKSNYQNQGLKLSKHFKIL